MPSSAQSWKASSCRWAGSSPVELVTRHQVTNDAVARAAPRRPAAARCRRCGRCRRTPHTRPARAPARSQVSTRSTTHSSMAPAPHRWSSRGPGGPVLCTCRWITRSRSSELADVPDVAQPLLLRGGLEREVTEAQHQAEERLLDGDVEDPGPAAWWRGGLEKTPGHPEHPHTGHHEHVHELERARFQPACARSSAITSASGNHARSRPTRTRTPSGRRARARPRLSDRVDEDDASGGGPRRR